MWDWIKKHIPIVVTILFAIPLIFYQEGCEPTVKSIIDDNKLVTRAELNVELERIVQEAALRNADLDKQEEVRKIILQNALLLASGQPLNPVGIITGLAAIYGIGSGVQSVKKRLTVTCEKTNAT